MLHHLFFLDSLIMAWLEILVYTLAQADSLSYIYNCVTFVMHNINSRLIREFT